jgi:hypothetical protein
MRETKEKKGNSSKSWLNWIMQSKHLLKILWKN